MTKNAKSIVSAKTDYLQWIGELKKRYKAMQCKAAVAVNSVMLEFYWELGKDINEKYPGKRRNVAFFAKLSQDLASEIGNAKGLSERNLHYALSFYDLYASYLPQVAADKSAQGYLPHVVADKRCGQGCQLVEQLVRVPWGHHRMIIDKCKGDREKALFYVRRTIQNGWSRHRAQDEERQGGEMTDYPYIAPCSYFLIYVYEIPGSVDP